MNIDKMGAALAHWLGYYDKIGKSFMLNEDSLKYPLADYFVNDGDMNVNTIKLEKAHPNFSQRYVDITIIDTNAVPNPVTHAFELKLAKSITRDLPEKRRIFNDLMRMHLCKKISTGSCYFIITGKSIHFERDFKKLGYNGVNFYDKWFAFQKGKSVTFNVSTETDQTYLNIYNNFINKYSGNYNGPSALQLPTTITTKCEFVTAFKSQLVPYMTGVWSVQ